MKNLQAFIATSTIALSCLLNPVQASPLTIDKPLANYSEIQSSDKSVSQKININMANADELTLLPGVGPKKAKQIIEYRELNGDFASIEELVNVKGIGVKMVARISNMVKV
jgi:competence protein ComEA